MGDLPWRAVNLGPMVRPDGRLCWTDNASISGCFQYYRKGGKLQVRRADPGHDFELGAVRVGPL